MLHANEGRAEPEAHTALLLLLLDAHGVMRVHVLSSSLNT
jgi:hypothetical protein